MKGLQPLFFHKGQTQFNPIIWRDGGGWWRWWWGSTSATACASGVRNRKGPFSRTVAPCELSTFVKGEGWKSRTKKKKRKAKSRLRGFYMLEPFQCAPLCVKRNNKGHRRFFWSERSSSNPPHATAAASTTTLHFLLPLWNFIRWI